LASPAGGPASRSASAARRPKAFTLIGERPRAARRMVVEESEVVGVAGGRAGITQHVRRQPPEGARGDPLALELLGRRRDHEALELGRVALAEAAQVCVGQREKQDAVGGRGDRLGGVLQARRAGEGGVGEAGGRVQADARVADLDGEGCCICSRRNKDKK